MDEIRAIESLEEMTILIKALLNDIAESFISVGFYLKKQNRTSCIAGRLVGMIWVSNAKDQAIWN